MENLPTEIQSFISDFEEKLENIESVVNNLYNNDYLQKNVLTPYEMAMYNLCTAYTLNSLFYVYLKSQGISPQDHPVTKELERMKVYYLKLKNLTDEEKVKLSKLDVDATSRIIQHSIGSQSKKQKKNDNK